MARYSSDSDSDRSSSRHRRKYYGRSTRSSSSDSSDSCSYKKRSSNKYSRSRRRRRSKSGDREGAPTRGYKSLSSKEPEKGRRRRGKKSVSRSPDRNGRRKGVSPSGRSGASGATRSVAVRPCDDKNTSAFVKDEFCIEPRIQESVLEEINSESFTPKTFSSSATAAATITTGEDNKFRNVVIDVSVDTIKAPAVKDPGDAPESIFHTSIMTDREARLDKWVKKLYTLRQKAITDATHTNLT